jgi:hypothetical protein
VQVKDLELDKISFSEAPTKTQLTNLLRDIHRFLSQLGGVLIASEAYTIADPPMGAMLNGAIQLKAAADQFEAGASQQNLVHAMPAPPAQMRRQ